MPEAVRVGPLHGEASQVAVGPLPKRGGQRGPFAGRSVEEPDEFAFIDHAPRR